MLHSDYQDLDNYEKFKFTLIFFCFTFMLFEIYNIFWMSFKSGGQVDYQNSIQKKPPKLRNTIEKCLKMSAIRRNKVCSQMTSNKFLISSKRLEIDKERTLSKLKENAAIKKYLEELLNAVNEKIPSFLYYISTTQFIRIIIQSSAIITLQYIPSLAIGIIFGFEVWVQVQNMLSFKSFKNKSSKSLSLLKIMSTSTLLLFLTFYIVKMIIGYKMTETSSILIIFLYNLMISFEFFSLILAYCIFVKEAVLLLIKKQNTMKTIKSNNPASNGIIFYRKVPLQKMLDLNNIKFKFQTMTKMKIRKQQKQKIKGKIGLRLRNNGRNYRNFNKNNVLNR